jgi:fructokinase
VDRHLVVGLGELLWDCFGGRRTPGGAPANVAYHARQLGMQAAVLSRVGQDPLGRELREAMDSRGVDITYLQVDAIRPTGSVTVEASDPLQPGFTIHEAVAWDALDFTEDWADALGRASAVCFGTLMQRSQANRQTLSRCLDSAQKALVVYDVNLRPPWYDGAWIRESLRRAAVVKFSQDEGKLLASLLGSAAGDEVSLARQMLEAYGLRAVFVTRGGRGADAVLPNRLIHQPPIPAEVVDTVGAGDAFTAGLIYGLLNGWPPDRTLLLASHVAAVVVARRGAMPEVADEYRTRIHSLGGG